MYELPISRGQFSKKEISSLREDENIEMIEEDVLDTGIDHLHHDLAPNFGGGVVGVAPNCSLLSVKVGQPG